MKRLHLLLTAILLLGLALPAHVWAQGFEGTVTMRQINVSQMALASLVGEDSDEEAEIDPKEVFAIPLERIIGLIGSTEGVEAEKITYHIKGNKLRVDDSSGGMPGYAVMDWGAGTFQLVSPDERVVMEMTKKDFEELKTMYPDDEGQPVQTKAEVRALNQTREINGMRTSAYEIRSEDEIAVVWVAPELKDLVSTFRDFESHMKEMGVISDEEEQTEVFMLVAEHGFPVLEQTFKNYGGYGNGDYDISEIVLLERKTVSADLFKVPADFERRSFMDVIRMFGGKPDN